jgi:hypothetical protein
MGIYIWGLGVLQHNPKPKLYRVVIIAIKKNGMKLKLEITNEKVLITGFYK